MKINITVKPLALSLHRESLITLFILNVLFISLKYNIYIVNNQNFHFKSSLISLMFSINTQVQFIQFILLTYSILSGKSKHVVIIKVVPILEKL